MGQTIDSSTSLKNEEVTDCLVRPPETGCENCVFYVLCHHECRA